MQGNSGMNEKKRTAGEIFSNIPNARFEIARYLLTLDSVKGKFNKISENPGFFERIGLILFPNKDYRVGGGSISFDILPNSLIDVKSEVNINATAIDSIIANNSLGINWSPDHGWKEFEEYAKAAIRCNEDINFLLSPDKSNHYISFVCKMSTEGDKNGTPIIIIHDSHGSSSKYSDQILSILSKVASYLKKDMKDSAKAPLDIFINKQSTVKCSEDNQQFDRFSCWFHSLVNILFYMSKSYEEVNQMAADNQRLFAEALPKTISGLKYVCSSVNSKGFKPVPNMNEKELKVFESSQDSVNKEKHQNSMDNKKTQGFFKFIISILSILFYGDSGIEKEIPKHYLNRKTDGSLEDTIKKKDDSPFRPNALNKGQAVEPKAPDASSSLSPFCRQNVAIGVPESQKQTLIAKSHEEDGIEVLDKPI